MDVCPFCLQMNIETLRENLYFQSKETLSATLEATLERTEDFTDSAYTSHEHRERILELSAQARRELQQLLSVWIQAVRTYFRPSKFYIIALPEVLRDVEASPITRNVNGPEEDQGASFLVSLLLGPRSLAIQHSQALASRGLFLVLATVDSVSLSPSLVHPVVPTLPPNSPLEQSSPKCIFSVKSRGGEPCLEVLGA